MKMSPAAEQYSKHFTFFFVSLRLLGKLAFRIFRNENESANSPSSPTPNTEHGRFLDRIDSKGIGLGIVEALLDDDNSVDSESNPGSPRILFGFRIKTDSPPLLASSEWSETSSDSETEANTNSQVGSCSPPRIILSCLSAREMELSEEYTRVTFHGPNPRIRHIYSNIIVHNSLFEAESSESSQEDDQTVYPSSTFLSSCSFCKKSIGRQDIFMWRGERAFCSAQCRYDGILMADEKEFLKVAAVKKTELLSVAAVKEG